MYEELNYIENLLETLAIARLLVWAKTGKDIRMYDLHVATVGLRHIDGETVTDAKIEGSGFVTGVYEARIWGTNLIGEPSVHLDVTLKSLSEKVATVLSKVYA